MIYFIEATGANLLKIGFTDREPEQRLRELQTGCPHKLRLVGSQEGGQAREQALHRQFDHLRETGEWFRLDEEMRGFLWFIRWASPLLGHLESAVEKLESDAVEMEERLSAFESITGYDIKMLRQAVFPRPSPEPAKLPDPVITDRIRRMVLEEFRSVTEMERFLEGPRGR